MPPCAPSQLFEVLNRKLMLVDEIKNDPRKDAQVGWTQVLAWEGWRDWIGGPARANIKTTHVMGLNL